MIPRGRKIDEACLSDYTFDRHMAGELDGAEDAAARAHLETCTRCRERLAALEIERSEFDVPLQLPRKRTHWGVRIGGVASVLAAAAALVLVLGRRPKPAHDEVRTKGAEAGLGFYVHHAGAVRAGGPDERVVPGDGLRFVVSTREPRFLAVLSVDGAKRASTYYPADANAALVGPGSELALPTSTELDDTLGSETIYGVFCPTAFLVEPLRHALEIRPTERPSPPGCTVETLHLHKEAAQAP